MRTLLFDVSNILFRVAATQTNKNPMTKDLSLDDIVGLCMHISLQSINKWYGKYKPDYVVFAFEGGNNWRKKYTFDHSLRRQYKANRVPDPAMAHFYELMPAFKNVIKNYTSICCLDVEGTEADDAIAVYCQQVHELNKAAGQTLHHVDIVSGDKDFVQLLKYDGVRLINPDTGKLRNQPGDKDYQEDIDYWLFLKCVRGDAGDNVPSAYPRVYETKIKEAYTDPYKRLNFMETRWKDENGTEWKVGDLFKHNTVLMALHEQPEDIRQKLIEEVKRQSVETKTYQHFHFLRFVGQFKLQRVGEEASRFVALFSHNQRYKKGEIATAHKPNQQQVILQEKPEAPATKTGLLEF